MKALDWQKQIPAPRLAHAEGMVVVDLDGRTIVFPSEAAAHFFHAAYAELPALAAEVETLRREIDEGALHTALARIAALEGEKAAFLKEIADLEARLTVEVERRTRAVQRATFLARTLRRVREML